MHLAALALAAALKTVPRPLRWPILVGASRLAAMHGRSGTGASKRSREYGETALIRLLGATSKLRLRFDPVLDHEGLENVEAALAKGGGVLAVGIHDGLSFLAVRHFFDVGRDPVVVALSPDLLTLGRHDPPRGVPVSATLLPDTLRHLRAGALVCAMLDRPAAEKGSYTVPTALGDVHISTPLLKLAGDARASILFVRARLDGRRVILQWFVATEPTSLASVKAQFSAFLRKPQEG